MNVLHALLSWRLATDAWRDRFAPVAVQCDVVNIVGLTREKQTHTARQLPAGGANMFRKFLIKRYLRRAKKYLERQEILPRPFEFVILFVSCASNREASCPIADHATGLESGRGSCVMISSRIHVW